MKINKILDMKNDFLFNKTFINHWKWTLACWVQNKQVALLDLDLVGPTLFLGEPKTGPSRVGGLKYVKRRRFRFEKTALSVSYAICNGPQDRRRLKPWIRCSLSL